MDRCWGRCCCHCLNHGCFVILHVGRRRYFGGLVLRVGLLGFLRLKGVVVGLAGWLVEHFLGGFVIFYTSDV